MTSWNDLLERNKKYAEGHTPKADLPDFKAPSILIFCCIDARVPVHELLNVKPEEAFAIRNTGGRVQRNLNDLIFMEATLPGVLTDVIIIHHTDCGCTYQSDDRLKAKLKDRHPNHLHKHIDEVEWNTFGSKERFRESVLEDLKVVKAQPLLPQAMKDKAKGYIYDIKTGKLEEVLYQ